MPGFLIMFLTAFIPLVIHISGLVVCIGGFRQIISGHNENYSREEKGGWNNLN